MVYPFLVGQLLTVAFDALCVGSLVSLFIQVDPDRLPRTVAWIKALDPKPGSSVPPWLYRWGTILMCGLILGYTQYLAIRYLVLFPTWASAYGPARFFWFAFDEVLVAAWAVYVLWVFRRAAR
jgi:hypothetical protein